jgi:glycosyltransferase involved in cell wall biosynthesis
MEIILVNDGSTDNSLAICRDFERCYSCICVVDKENGGVSSARNTGLNVATGKYVLFVDSDDYVSATLIYDLEQLLAERDWDLIMLSNCIDDGKTRHMRVYQDATFQSRNEAFPRLIDDICNKALNSPCAKVYQREILKQYHINFPLGVSVAEDRAFNIHYSLYVDSYRVSEKVAYFVNTENENSLSRKRHADLDTQFAIADKYTLKAILDSNIPEREQELYRQAINFSICRGIYKTAKDLRRDQKGWLTRQKELWKHCLEINQAHMKYPNTTYCRKIALPVQLQMTLVIDLIAKWLLK